MFNRPVVEGGRSGAAGAVERWALKWDFFAGAAINCSPQNRGGWMGGGSSNRESAPVGGRMHIFVCMLVEININGIIEILKTKSNKAEGGWSLGDRERVSQ